jgi:hypothetical protein
MLEPIKHNNRALLQVAATAKSNLRQKRAPMNMKLVMATGALAAFSVAPCYAGLMASSDAGPGQQYGQERPAPAQTQTKSQQPNEAEAKAAAKVETAPDPNAKLQAAGEFVKKYPKSTLRPKVAGYLATHINNLPDPAQKITLLENLLTVFKEPSDGEIISPLLYEAYMKSQPPRVEDAFRVASAGVARNPEDLTSQTQLAVLSVQQVKNGDGKYLQPGQQSAQKAIQIIEAGKKPDAFDDARWSEYQTKWLPYLYQSLGVFAMVNGNRTEAQAKLEKASSLSGSDPFNFWLLGNIANQDYQKVAEQYNAQAKGPQKDELLKQAQSKMDQVIELYAHVVALSEGKQEYEKLHGEALGDLQTYWKFRHAGSLDGLQQLIDKYKKP